MKQQMVAVSVLAAAVWAAPAVFADDGSWSTDFRLSQGPIYSQQENRDISLDKEILAFDGFDSGLTRAIFFFHNTASSPRTVEAGFPVRVSIGVMEDAAPGSGSDTALYLSKGKYEDEAKGIEYARLVLGGALQQGQSSDDMDHSSLYFSRGDIPARLRLTAAQASDLFKFSITQDGQSVPFDFVIVESAVVAHAKTAPALEMTFHFHHVLTFGAGAQSRVEVRYSGDYLSGRESGGHSFTDEFAYTYLLGTGRTWKGPIGQLYLGVPPDAGANLPKAFADMGRVSGKELYLAERYEPAASDQIELYGGQSQSPESYLSFIWFDQPQTVEAPTKPAQDFVTVRGASSSLKDTSPVYTDDGVIPKSVFGPLSLFDGIRQTAWAEAAAGDGIGEWVEFGLSRDVQGFVVQNGFNMSFQKIDGKTIDTYYKKNNRPKTIEIVSTDQKVSRSFDLADTKDLQEFSLSPLPKGAYRLYIRAVYPGSQWKDTCLGEITFLPATPKSAQLLKDTFLQAHISDISGN